MSDRDRLIDAFLDAHGLGEAERRPLPGDASTRRYERLARPGRPSLMLMDQPPSAETPPCDPAWTPEERRARGWNAVARLSAGRVEAFCAVAAHLGSLGLSAPAIVAARAADGLALTEDFGDALFARVMAAGEAEAPLYLAAVEALARLHQAGAPPPLIEGPAGDWPILDYDAMALMGGADLFVEWLPRLEPSVAFDAAAIQAWHEAWEPIVASGAAGAAVLAHRDYHAENLIWLPEREGAARVGMIDFQDAVRAHPSWDLHSLLQDARRDVSAELEAAALDRYFALRPEVGRDAFMADYDGLAALNEARIIGVFARLIARDGKPRYREFLPRMWRRLNVNLERPALAPVARWFDRHLPAEARA